MNPFTYSTDQADVFIAQGMFAGYPWLFYARRANSSLAEFAIDQQGTHQGVATWNDCAAQWLIVGICKCELQARVTHGPHWRDHRLRLIRAHVLPDY